MLASTLGIRLILWLGASKPTPAPAAVMTALTHVQVRNDVDKGDGFQLTFALSKGKDGDYALLRSGALDPDRRVAIGVMLGATVYPLLNGVIYHHQVSPGREPGSGTLTVMGRDLGAILQSENKNKLYPSQADSTIVENILKAYAQDGLGGPHEITKTQETPTEKQRQPSQQSDDLRYIQNLAAANGYTFYVEPRQMGNSCAYWGQQRPTGTAPALRFNVGSASNVKELHFTQDAQAGVRAEGFTIDAQSKKSKKIPSPKDPLEPLAAKPIGARRSTQVRNLARYTPAQAARALEAARAAPPPAVVAEGNLETIRYGAVLRARCRVKVSGAGRTHDGDYYVRAVTHEIERNVYTQHFSLSREGLGARP